MTAACEAIGIDLGGTHLRGARMMRDRNGVWERGASERVLWRSPGSTDPAEALRALEASLAALLPRLGATASAPVGFAVAGQLDAAGRVMRNAPNMQWRDVPLAEAIEGWIDRPVRLINDVKAAWLGEWHTGAGRGCEGPMVAVFWGTGIGGAFGEAGRVWRGAGGNAGEVGHVKVPGSSALCGCGEVGCIEALVGGRALERALSGMRWGALGAFDAALAGGEEDARAQAERWGEPLACVLAGMCTVVSPERLVVGGGVVGHAPALAEWVVGRTRELTLAVTRSTLRVVKAEQGDWAGVFGAAIDAASER
jgi:glucokinase